MKIKGKQQMDRRADGRKERKEGWKGSECREEERGSTSITEREGEGKEEEMRKGRE